MPGSETTLGPTLNGRKAMAAYSLSLSTRTMTLPEITYQQSSMGRMCVALQRAKHHFGDVSPAALNRRDSHPHNLGQNALDARVTSGHGCASRPPS